MEVIRETRGLCLKSLNEEGFFSGYASVFGVCDHMREVVAAGAFRRSLRRWEEKRSLPAMLWMHDPARPVGIWLKMKEDGNGLAVEGQLALRTKGGREAYELLKIGALSGMSIGYRVVGSRVDAAQKVRILTEVDLFEVSLVTFPANDEARVQVVKSPVARLYQAAAALRGLGGVRDFNNNERGSL